MESSSGPQSGINAWLEEELLQQYQRDRTSVDPLWKNVFEHNGSASNGSAANVALKPAPAAPVISGAEELMPLRGAPARLAANMASSVTIPLATSQRVIPVKVVDENRRLINHHRGLIGKSKVSYTHLIGWAVIRAVQA